MKNRFSEPVIDLYILIMFHKISISALNKMSRFFLAESTPKIDQLSQTNSAYF